MKRVCKKLVSAAMVAVMAAACAPTTQMSFIAPLRVEVAAAQEIGITESSGWLESAWVEWNPTSTEGVSYYRVAYSKDGNSFTTIDDQLVRMYRDGHWRADIVGISAGTYTLRVEAYNSSDAVVASETASVTVEAHDRTGFNFSPESTCYDSSDPLQSGGYKGDGTPKDNAEILYITSAEDVNTVTDSTGTTGLSTILEGRNKRTDRPLIVRIVGKIDYSGSELNGSGYIQVKPSKSYTNYNTTIEGIGEDSSINFGILLRNAGNVEVRNLAVHDFGDDGISLDTDNCNIWLHNNEFFYGEQGSGDKAKGDGSSDVKNDSQYVTLSYNHYWDAGKCSLCGMTSETGENYITYHHNWFDHSDSRHPRIRTMFVHIYNNFYDGNAKYGVGASADSDAFVEGNYFRNCKYPTLQGSVGHDAEGGGSATFDDSPAIGAIKLYNNIMEGSLTQFTAGSDGETASNADGCVVETRDQRINYTTAAGATYSNADVDNAYVQSLASVIQEPADAKTTVEKYAGRTGGGDFAQATGFAFNDSVDDPDYEINTTLRAAITSYVTDDISSNHVIATIGGSVDGSVVPEPPTETTTEGDEPTTEPTTGDEPTTEPTTSSLTPLDEGEYAAADIVSDTAKFLITGNSGKDGQIKIDESGSVKFNVAAGANVSISYKCGSSNSSKSASISCAGKTGETLVGSSGSNPITSTLELTGLSAGDYTITASQNGGTTAQIISIVVSYGNVPTESTSETSTETTTETSSESTTEPTTEPVPQPGDKVWGDADSSGILTANDAATILHYTLYPADSAIADDMLPYCNVDAEGEITANDAALVLQKTLFNITFPAEQ